MPSGIIIKLIDDGVCAGSGNDFRDPLWLRHDVINFWEGVELGGDLGVIVPVFVGIDGAMNRKIYSVICWKPLLDRRSGGIKKSSALLSVALVVLDQDEPQMNDCSMSMIATHLCHLVSFKKTTRHCR